MSRLGAAHTPAARGEPVDCPVDCWSGPGPGGLEARHRQSTVEMLVGAGLVVMVCAAGLYFAHRSSAGPVDRWILGLVPAGDSGWFRPVTWLRYPAVTVVGSIVAAALVFRRDRPRAFACLVGPTIALVTCELLVKPATGRTLGGVYSYPSGSTVGAAALATVAVLAASTRWRAATTVAAVAFSVWMAAAVVTLHWHYPSDALAGLAYGAGVALLVDGSAWRIAARLRPGERVLPEPARRRVDG